MIGTIDKTDLYKIAWALEILDKRGYFHFIRRSAQMFSNYEFIFHIEKRVTIPVEIPVDFLTGVVPFTFKGPDTETCIPGKCTIARIDNKGLTLFPVKLCENVSDAEAQEGYKEFKMNYLSLYDNILDIIDNENENENEKLQYLEEPYKEVIAYKNITGSSFMNLIKPVETPSLPVEDAIELHPGMFYLNNEYVATQYTGGMWNILDIIDMACFDEREAREFKLYGFEDELNLLNEVLHNSNHSLYIEAHILFEGEPDFEPILKLGWIPIDLINREHRGIHNGIYSPIGKSKFIAGLDITLPIKEYLERINRYIETLPLFEQKQGVIKHIVSMFQEKGYLEGLAIDGFSTEEIAQAFRAFTETFKELVKEEKEHHQRDEAAHIQQKEFMNRWRQQLPAFLNELDKEHRIRYIKIIKNICELTIPVTQEDSGLYKNIITDFGTLAGNIIQSIIKPRKSINVTISNLADNQEILSILEKKLPATDLDHVKEFSRNQGPFFNKVRHPDIPVSFNEFYSFIKETQAVLELFMKNK